MTDYAERTKRVIGEAAAARLNGASVALFGVGGVGSYAAEALCRAGVGRILLVDGDVVSDSNRNRQLVALRSTVGLAKAEVMAARMRDIREDVEVEARALFYDDNSADQIDLASYDYVLDAIDSVPSKLMLIERCRALNVPILCCMGAGNRLDPMGFRVSDIGKTSVCPLARRMRRELRLRGIEHVDVVWSAETPIKPEERCADGSNAPGSLSFVPAAAGLLMAGTCVKRLIDLGEAK